MLLREKFFARGKADISTSFRALVAEMHDPEQEAAIEENAATGVTIAGVASRGQA